MNFDLNKSLEVLERTPAVLEVMLHNISIDWTSRNEGGETWSVYDIIGHLIHGERTNWIPRAKIILSRDANRTFEPFDRVAQFKESDGKSLAQLLEKFKAVRQENIEYLRSITFTHNELEKKGIHPALGEVTLGQLLSTWVVHDLDHISQISRVMAKQYKTAVGPWAEYLRILRS